MSSTPDSRRFVLFVAFVGLAFLVIVGRGSSATTVPAGPIDGELRVAAQMAVEANLRDPGSAEFRDVVVVKQDSLTAVCGEVNAKNGFGGYTGYTSFVAIGSLVQIQTRRDDGFATLWNAACVRPRGKWDRAAPTGHGDPVPP